MGTVISLLATVFLETILKALLNCSIFISEKILDESLTVFNNNDNIIESALGVLNLRGSGIAQFFIGVGKGMVLVIFLTQIVDSLAKSAIGEESEHPLKITGRCIFTYLLIVAMFGTRIFNIGYFNMTSGILGIIGRWGAELIGYIKIPYDSLQTSLGISNGASWIEDFPSKVGALILYASLLGSTLGASISYIERFASLGLTVVMGPICLSLNAAKDSQSAAKEWLSSIIIQFFCIFLSLSLWAFFIGEIKTRGTSTVFELVILVIALNLMKDSEQIFKALGFRTMPNIDSAKAMMGGIASATKIAGSASKIGKGLGNGLKKAYSDIRNKTGLVGFVSNQIKNANFSAALNKNVGKGKNGLTKCSLPDVNEVNIGGKQAMSFQMNSNGKKVRLAANMDGSEIRAGSTFSCNGNTYVANGQTHNINGKTYSEANLYNAAEFLNNGKKS